MHIFPTNVIPMFFSVDSFLSTDTLLSTKKYHLKVKSSSDAISWKSCLTVENSWLILPKSLEVQIDIRSDLYFCVYFDAVSK